MTVADAPARSSSRRSIGARLTAKAGPLPVWAWAAMILVGGYLVYRLRGGGSSTATTAATSSDTSSAGSVDTSSTPVGSGDVSSDTGSAGAGGAASNVNDSLLSQLSGFQSSIDALTAAVQTTPGYSQPDMAYPSPGFPGAPLQTSTPSPAAKVAAPAPRPSATPRAPAKIHYYTYAPGRAPRNEKRNEAPAHGPAGTRLHFARGKGYYYA